MSVKLMTNLLVYRVSAPLLHLHDQEQLNESLATHPARIPAITELNAIGFMPLYGEDEHYVDNVNATTKLLAVNFADRMLPGKVVRQRVMARVREIEDEEGRRVFAREKNQIKDKVITEMLPHTFVDQKVVNVLIQGPYIIIDSTSAKKGEDILCLLRQVLGTLNVRPVCVDGTPIQKFTEWFTAAKVGDGEKFCLTGDFKAISSDDEIDSLNGKGTSPKSEGLSDLVFEHNRRVTVLGLQWESRDEVVTFTVNEMLGIKGIKWPESIADMAASDAGEDKDNVYSLTRATFLLLAAEIQSLLSDLLHELGGEKLPEGEDTSILDALQGALDARLVRMASTREGQSFVIPNFTGTKGEDCGEGNHTFLGNTKTGRISPCADCGAAPPEDEESDTFDEDALYIRARVYVKETSRASISALQRELRIGYNRAARLIERLEEDGVVTEMNSSGGREVIKASKTVAPAATALDDEDTDIENLL